MEDGEIEDDGDEGYVLISRPEVPPPSAQPRPLNVYSGNSSEDESDTDTSDSDSHSFRTKRPKYKMEKCPTVMPNINPFQANPKKKWDIWSTPLQEEVLSETLGNFGVDLDSKMDRSVESYDYKLGYAYNLNKDMTSGSSPCTRISDSVNDIYAENKFVQEHVGNKRKSAKERLGRKKKSDKLIYSLKKLKVTPDNNPEVVARHIADGLMEEKDYLISRVVEVFGKKRAIELYNQTRAIEADGGMMVMDMSRRRTPGGVFLKLVSNDEHVDQEKIKEILREEHKAQNNKLKKLVARKRRKKTNAVREELITNGLLNNDLSDMSIKTDIKEEGNKTEDDNVAVKIELTEHYSRKNDLSGLFLKSEIIEREIKTEENSVGVKSELCEEINDEQTLTNPPPSPATDQDTPPPPHEREFISYEDYDYLEIETDMDLL